MTQAAQTTIGGLARTQIRFVFRLAIATIAVLVIGSQVFQISSNRKRSEAMIVNYATTLARNAAITQEFLYLQRELDGFARAISESQQLNIFLEIRHDDRLIAQVGSPSRYQLFVSITHQETLLPSGRKIEVWVYLDHSPLILSTLFLLFGSWTLAALIFSALEWRLSRSLLEITDPLSLAIHQLNKAAAGLPNSTQWETKFGGHRITEIHMLSDSVNKLFDEISTLEGKVSAASSAAARATLAEQVAHDIRSPLAALEVVIRGVSDLPEDLRLLVRGAVDRIRDIANSLLRERKLHSTSEPNNVPEPFAVGEALEGLIAEKRARYVSRSGLVIELSGVGESYGAYLTLREQDLLRVLSNLIDNSAEAIRDTGRISIGLNAEGEYVEIKISDTGQGISPELLSRIGTLGLSVGKEGGSGLGVHHARAAIEAVGGSITYQSEVGTGTQVTLQIPRAKPPGWHVHDLQIPDSGVIVILDDDPTIHAVWSARFKKCMSQDQHLPLLKHFYHPAQLALWLAEPNENKNGLLFLVDFELFGVDETGLDIVQRLGVAPKSILVTSHSKERALQEKCRILGVRILPKSMAAWVPLKFH